MSVALSSPEPGRTTRLTALVSAAEADAIARLAAAAGLSVSAYLRDRALGSGGGDEAALREVDRMIARMEQDLDAAVGEIASVLARMDAAA